MAMSVGSKSNAEVPKAIGEIYEKHASSTA
jgi:hypothetical protein